MGIMDIKPEAREKLLKRKGMTLEQYYEWERREDEVAQQIANTRPDESVSEKFKAPLTVYSVEDDE